MSSDRTTLDEAASWTVIAVAFVVAAMVDGLRWWWRFVRGKLRAVAKSYSLRGQRGKL